MPYHVEYGAGRWLVVDGKGKVISRQTTKKAAAHIVNKKNKEAR